MHQLDFRKLRYFSKVAELGSFTKAAENLNVAQPALSRQIKLLEEELGIQLMARTARGITLTEAGVALQNHVHALARSLSSISEDMQARAGSPKGQVSIGVVLTSAQTLIPPLVERLKQEFPMVTLRIVEGVSLQLANWVDVGTIDLAVLSYAVRSQSLHQQSIATEEIAVIERPTAVDLPVAYSLAALLEKPLVLSDVFAAMVRSEFSMPELRFNMQLEIDAMQATKVMVMQGLGATLLPVSLVHDELASGALVGSTIGARGVRRQLTLVRSSIRERTKAIEAVSNTLIALVEQMQKDGLFSLPDRKRRRAARAKVTA